MKKFLLFLVGLVLCVSIGLTTYYFLRNDEVISVKTKEIYCNVGDIITLDDIGIVVKKPYKKTQYNYNAGGEEVTNMVSYDSEKGYYETKQGGEVQIVISTTNKRCPEFKISLHIGEGTAENPYYIENQTDLDRIGDVYALDASYKMISDVTLASNFKPIGFNYSTNQWVGFAGTFDGNGKTINALRLISDEYTNAGLFFSLNNATVTNLTIKNAEINGAYNFAGVLAGEMNNTIVRSVAVVDSSITNTQNNSTTGALAGSVVGANSKITMTYAENNSIELPGTVAEDGVETPAMNVIAGGLVGELNRGTLQATYSANTISVGNVQGDIAGMVGKFVVDAENGAILESYSTTSSESDKMAAFISTVNSNGLTNDNAKQLRYFAGNMVVVPEGRVAVRNYDNTFFNKKFYDPDNSLYLIREFKSVEELNNNPESEYIYYAMSQSEKVNWEESAWRINLGSTPKLRATLTDANLLGLSPQYLLKDLSQETIGNITNSAKENAQILANFLKDNAVDGKVSNKSIVLAGGELDFSEIEWTAYDLENCVVDGLADQGAVLKNVTLAKATNNQVGLFGTLTNSTVRNLKVEGLTIASDGTNVGAVAGRLASNAEVRDVEVTYSNVAINQSITNFGGLVGVTENGTSLVNSKANTIGVNAGANIQNAGSVVGSNSGVVDNCEGNGTISSFATLGGVAGINNGSIRNSNVDVILVHNSTTASTNYVGGLVGLNEGVVNSSSALASISIENATSAYVGGVAGLNDGRISNVNVYGDGIAVSEDVQAAFVAGIVAVNNSNIDMAACYMQNVGTYIEGKEIVAAGVVAINNNANSVVTRAIVSANIHGNYVAGVVYEQDNGSALIDQVFVGKIDNTTQEISDVTIEGDKYVAGVAYRLMRGVISNVQTNSAIYGNTNNTRTSLIVLHFPDAASFVNSTINSSLNGYGVFYKDTWVDYSAWTPTTSDNQNDNYNIYSIDAAAGSMQGVVVNTEKAQSAGKTYTEGKFRYNWWLFGGYIDSYANSEESSYVKDIDNAAFSNAASFKDTFTIRGAHSSYTKTLAFDFESVWAENNGIRLAFLNGIAE